MKNESYKFLTKDIKDIDEQELLMIINYRIDIILESRPAVETLQALICKVESENNRTSFYNIIGLSYSFIILLTTLVADALVGNGRELQWKVYLVAVIGISALALLVLSGIEKKNSERRTFILFALKSKYEIESLKSKNQGIKSVTCDENERTYIVKVEKRK